MKYVFLVVKFFVLTAIKAQDISGSWRWVSEDDARVTEIVLKRTDSLNYKGKYCSVFNMGEKLDCSDESNMTNIKILKTEENIFVGSFTSSFSNEIGKLKLTYSESSSQLELEIMENPNGEFYLPSKVYFKK